MRLSHRAHEIPASLTLELDAKVAALVRDGVDVVSLGAGQPDFPTPPAALEALDAFLKKSGGRVGYTAASGIPPLREAAAAWLSRVTGVAYEPDQIVVTCGAKEALAMSVLALADAGDEVIVPTPSWLSYAPMVRIADASLVGVPTDPGNAYKLKPADLDAALTDRTRALMLNSPSNPTGAVYTKDELSGLADVLRGRDVTVISDEIYSAFVYGGDHVSIASMPGMAEQTIVVHGMSKAFAMTGWRIGFLAAPHEATRRVANLKSQVTANAATSSQHAALGALTAGDGYSATMREAFQRRRDLALSALREMPGVEIAPPDGAFYVFPRVDAFYGGAIGGSVDMCKALLDDARVAAVPGAVFGEDRCIRLSIATSDDRIVEGMSRLAGFLAGLRSTSVPR